VANPGDNFPGRTRPLWDELIMRKLLLLALLIGVTGCQGGLFRNRDKDKDRSSRVPDPLLSPDLDEQQRWGRARYSYPESDRNIAPPTYADRPTPSGR
jgi:hypothetical protein